MRESNQIDSKRRPHLVPYIQIKGTAFADALDAFVTVHVALMLANLVEC